MTVAVSQPNISEAERQRRQKAINTARASVRLEGFILNDESETLFSRYINGELTRSELNAEILRLAGVHD